MQTFNWQFWLRNCALLLLLLINQRCATHADVVNDGCLDAADNAQTLQQYQLLGMADVPLVAQPPHDEIVRSQRSLFKKLFKNFGLEDLFDDDGQSLCVNCCNNNNNGGAYNEDNAYGDAEGAQPPPPPPFDPLYSPFQPFVPMQPLPPFGALPPLPQPFSLLRPIIGGITGNRGGNVAPQPLPPPPPPPPPAMPLPPVYKEPNAVSYDEVGDGYPPKSPPSVYEAPLPQPPAPAPAPAPEVKYGNEAAPISVGAAKGAAPQVIYQPIIFVSPPLKSPYNQKECTNSDQYELPQSTPAPPINNYTPSYAQPSLPLSPQPPPAANSYITPYTPSPSPAPPPPPPPPSEQLYIAPTEAPPPQPPQLPTADAYAVPTLPPYAANAPTVDYQNQYTPSNVADGGYPQTYSTAPPTGSVLQPYGGITSISATYTIVAPFKAPSTPQPPAVGYRPQNPLPCHMRPVQLTLADQPYRDCPELFTNYQRNLNAMPIIN